MIPTDLVIALGSATVIGGVGAGCISALLTMRLNRKHAATIAKIQAEQKRVMTFFAAVLRDFDHAAAPAAQSAVPAANPTPLSDDTAEISVALTQAIALAREEQDPDRLAERAGISPTLARAILRFHGGRAPAKPATVHEVHALA